MKILLVAHRLPYPLEWGQHLRLLHLAGHLSVRHEIELIAFGEKPYPDPLTAVFRTIDTLPIPAVPRTRLTLRRALHALDVEGMLPYSDEMATMLRRHVESTCPDVVWIGGPDMLPYVARDLPVRVIGDTMDDGVVERWRYLIRARDPIAVMRCLKWLIMTARWERRYFRRPECCVFVSDIDARWARRIVPGLPVSVVENGVDPEFFQPVGHDEEFPSLVFEGNQGFPPNADAVDYFTRRIFPLILRRFPRCRFYVVGRSPAPSTLALARDNVIVTGRVDDIRPYLEQASVFVCPMRLGAGIKNKILQAWAMEKPVVATHVAVGGLQAVSGQNIVVAKEADGFAEATIRLLSDPLMRRELGKAARDTVLTRYTWHRQARAFERVLRGA